MTKNLEYIIIQAGGRGSRMNEYTDNKPKALVSVNNLPIIFHLFKKYPNKKYVIIGDYHKDVLDKYLETFADVEFITVGTDNNKGTCSGIRNALKIIPDNKKFMLIWCDLILSQNYEIPTEKGNYVGTSDGFPCRWSFESNMFIEKPSTNNGVAGLFIFNDKKVICNVPPSGEFVKWLQSTDIKFEKTTVIGAEYGLYEKIDCPKSGKCRPFNKTCIKNGKFIKEGITKQGLDLAIREKTWYHRTSELDVNIPKIFSFEPLTMEAINGKNVFLFHFDNEKKKTVIKSIIDSLDSLHKHDIHDADRFSMKDAYYSKTMARISKVRNLIPYANQETITINGKKCRNIFFHMDEFKKSVDQLSCNHFCLIHGDCTFSNIMLRNETLEPVMIDPRGYFGKTELIGDESYDWAKLYYSICGNYDQFNLGRFSLKIDSREISLIIKSNEWECTKETFIENIPSNIKIKNIELIHAIIWLSLTTYAWNDYDSVCGAFYNGLYYLEDCL